MRHQDTLSQTEVHSIAAKVIPAAGDLHLTRLHSENHQVYRVTPGVGAGEDVVIKIAGRGTHREKQIPFEVSVLQAVAKSLCVPTVLAHGLEPRPWFCMPWHEPLPATEAARDDCIVDHITRIARQAPELSAWCSCKLEDISFEIRSTLVAAMTDARLQSIHGDLLWRQETLESVLARTPTVLGQPQPGEVIMTSHGYTVVDWSEGFAQTYLARQVDCLTYYDAAREHTRESIERAYARASRLCAALSAHGLAVDVSDVTVFWLLRCLANGLWLSEQQATDAPIQTLLETYRCLSRFLS